MAMLDGVISEEVFKFVTGLFFSIAIITGLTRTAIRWHLNRKFEADDYLLFFALICSIVSTTLLYVLLPTIYLSANLYTQKVTVAKLLTLKGTADWFRELYHAYFILAWTAIFAVKFAFLAFFKRLVSNLGWISTYWKIVVGISFVSWIYCVVDGFIACTLTGTSAIKCAQPPLLYRATALTALATALDIATEIMIVVIPIWILHAYRRSSRQKIGMGVFLCLNAVQAIVAIIRMAGIRSRFTLDHTWNDFWQQIEMSIAIIMVSLTAFRSFSVAERQRVRRAMRYGSSPGGAQGSPFLGKWYGEAVKVLTGSSGSRSRRGDEGEETLRGGVELDIPGPTLTGMRTFISREGSESRFEPEAWERNGSGDLESLGERRRVEPSRALQP